MFWTLLQGCCLFGTAARSFIVQNDSFVQDGQPMQIRAGSMHYARVPSAYWKDRLQRLQAMGLNAISTYVPWNWHETDEGKFNFEGDHDLVEFLRTANDVGMLVLLRAGPYICGEWEFGGLPAWILNHNVTIRTYEPNYIALVDKWFAELLSRVKPMLYSNGGSVVLLQVENEFGSYGNVMTRSSDMKYMEHLVDIVNSHLGAGAVVLYTTDGGNSGSIGRGSLNGSSVVSTGDGKWACSAQAEFNPPGLNPCMNSETYTGWLTHWGEQMANKSASDKGVANAVRAGNSFNLYMGHGGTNFGFMSGSNGGGKGFQPDITSYDYNSPVSENGDHGYGKGGHDKFNTFLEALTPFAPEGGFPPEPAPLPRKAYGEVHLTEMASLLSEASLQTLAPEGVTSIAAPMAMEKLGQNYGFILYTSTLSKSGSMFEIKDYPRDRAQVFVDGVYQGAIYRPEAAPLNFSAPAKSGSSMAVLVENMGRLNFGHGMTDPKGITTDVMLDGEVNAFENWKALSLPLEYSQVAKLTFSPAKRCDSTGPTFFKGVLNIPGAPADTYLKPSKFTKGVMWVNGVNIGRYWETKGPQHAFYVPAPYLQTGANDVVILELESGSECTVQFDDKPDFSGQLPTECSASPKEGDVLRMTTCAASLEENQGWTQQNTSSGSQLKLGDLCLTVGQHTDAQSGQPSAQITNCDAGSILSIDENGIKETDGGLCLDITANGEEKGEPVEWYKCNKRPNQVWQFRETPSHLIQIVSSMDGKCLSACGVSAVPAGGTFVI